jgi:hypothetical protein
MPRIATNPRLPHLPGLNTLDLPSEHDPAAMSHYLGLDSDDGGAYVPTAPARKRAAPYAKGPLRKGKWTPEEELYAHFIIENFNKGLINLSRGELLRASGRKAPTGATGLTLFPPPCPAPPLQAPHSAATCQRSSTGKASEDDSTPAVPRPQTLTFPRLGLGVAATRCE